MTSAGFRRLRQAIAHAGRFRAVPPLGAIARFGPKGLALLAAAALFLLPAPAAAQSPGVTVSSTHLSITEGATGAYTVVLDTQPTGDVTVSVSVADDTSKCRESSGASCTGTSDVATVDKTSLTFKPSDWNQPQTVTVTAVEEDMAGFFKFAKVTHTVSGGGYGGVTASPVTITISDNDSPGVTVSPNNLSITEGGTGAYTVVLTSEPTDDVTVSVSVADDTGRCNETSGASCTGTSGVATVDKTSLTFKPSDWNTAQTVTVTAVDEDMAGVFKFAKIDHTVSGGGYDAVVPASVKITISDPDRRGSAYYVPNPDGTRGREDSALSLAEDAGPERRKFWFALETEPTTNTTVTFASSIPAVSGFTPPSLTFTPSNWSVSRQVTFDVDDNDIDESGDRKAQLSATAAGSDYENHPMSSFFVTVRDNDTAGVTVTPTDLGTVNEGATGAYTVVLTSEPTSDVTVSVSVADDTSKCRESSGASCTGTSGVATVDKPSLTFKPADWNIAQTVTVTAVDEDMAGKFKYAKITHTVSGGGYDGLTASPVTITVSDNDTVGVTVSPTHLGSVKEGKTDTYTVVLNTEPTGEVTVSVSVADDTSKCIATSGASCTRKSGVATVDKPSLKFSTQNWDQPQTVTVTAVDEDMWGEFKFAKVTHTVSGGDYGGVTASPVTIIVEDNDDRRPVYYTPNPDGTRGPKGSAFRLNEDAGPELRKFWFALGTEPTTNTTVTFASSIAAVSGLTPPSLTFTPSNWNNPRQVAFDVDDNDIDDGSHRKAELSATAAGSDYDNHPMSSLFVTVGDNDTAGATVTPTSLDIFFGATGTYTAVLTSEPTGDVDISVTSGDPDVATVDKTTLTFTPADWDQPQTVTVTAGSGAGGATVSHTASGGGYDAVTIDGVTVSAVRPPREVQVLDASAKEGEAAVFTVEVSPAAGPAVTLSWKTADGTAVSGKDYAAVTAGGVTVPADAGQATFRVMTIDDRLAEDDETFSVTLSGALPIGTIFAPGGDTATGTILNNDTAGIALSAETLRIGDASGKARYTVRLQSRPEAAVTVAVESDDLSIARAAPASLAFTPADWNVPQSVTVTAVEDGSSSIVHRAFPAEPGKDPRYAGLTKTLPVTVEKDPAAIASPWLARFARTHAGHVLDDIAARLTAPDTPGARGRIAGHEIAAARDGTGRQRTGRNAGRSTRDARTTSNGRPPARTGRSRRKPFYRERPFR